MDHEKNITISDEARASNPGGLKPNKLKWFASYPKWPLIWLVSLLIFAALALTVHSVFWIPAVLLLGMNWLYWVRINGHFSQGDANPGIVVATNPTLIAVATDLTKGFGEYPVLKIFEKNLSTVCGQQVKEGAQLATVALYSMDPDESVPHWKDFDPRPVDCATNDLEANRAVLASFDDEAWEVLQAYLAKVPKPYAPGLYRIDW